MFKVIEYKGWGPSPDFSSDLNKNKSGLFFVTLLAHISASIMGILVVPALQFLPYLGKR